MRQIMRLLMASSKKKEAKKPLTFTAQQANSTVKLTKTGTPTVSGLEYRLGTSGGWTPYTINTVITLANVGDVVQFQNTEQTLSTSTSNYVKFVMAGKIGASGNIQSMLNYIEQCKNYCYNRMFSGCSNLTTAPELPATKIAYYCYSRMFSSCSSLTNVPELPATTLADFCYNYMFYNCSSLTTAPALPATTLTNSCYSFMFSYCTSLKIAPELPATTLATDCCSQMFSNCSNLIKAPETLPATTLAQWCYYGMFQNCKSLTVAPELPATNLVGNCYYQMFYGCTKLNYIKVGFKNWLNNATSNWVSGVASSGTFIAPPYLPERYGTSYIPLVWTLKYDDPNVMKTPSDLTSNVGENFTLSQSVQHPSYPAWMAMDGFTDSSTMCVPATTNDFGWWQIQFDKPVKIYAIKLNLGERGAYLESSEDGENWVAFDNKIFNADTTTDRSYNTDTYYKFYRIRVSAANTLYINDVIFVYEQE